MSHVREGEIHAYLDGALDRLGRERATEVREHVGRCEDCRGRLEEERRLRDAADRLLDLGAPETVDMPPFEEIRRRAQAGARARDATVGPTREPVRPPAAGRAGDVSGPTRRLPDLQRWAWAASVVLALGTGWLLRGSDLVRSAGYEGEQAPGFAESADFSAASPDALTPIATVRSDRAMDAPAEVRVAPAREGSLASRAEEEPAAAAANVAGAAAAEADAIGRLAANEVADDRSNAAGADTGAARAEGAIDLLQRRAVPTEVVARPVAASPAAAMAVTELRDVLLNEAVERDEAAGERESSLLAPGLELVAVTGDSATVWVIQRFPEGDTLRLEFVGVPAAYALLERSVGAGLEARPDRQAPAADPAAQRARAVEAEARMERAAEDRPAQERPAEERPGSEVRLVVDGGLLIVRSQRPQEELEALVRAWRGA